MSQDYLIRRETEADYRAVEELVREAFWDVYRPGCLEHFLLHELRSEPDFVAELDFVMEKGGELIGQSVSYRTAFQAYDGKEIPILMLGPICIAPKYQGLGYGKALLTHTFREAAALGCGAYCFEGNIAFYGQCGAVPASEHGIGYQGLPEGEDASFFLCKELLPGYLKGVAGSYATPAAYLVDNQAAEDYDRSFPPREKHVLPGQIFSA